MHGSSVFLYLRHGSEARDWECLLAAGPQPGQRALCHGSSVTHQDFTHGIPLAQPIRIGLAIFEIFHPLRAFLSADVINGWSRIGGIFIG